MKRRMSESAAADESYSVPALEVTGLLHEDEATQEFRELLATGECDCRKLSVKLLSSGELTEDDLEGRFYLICYIDASDVVNIPPPSATMPPPLPLPAAKRLSNVAPAAP